MALTLAEKKLKLALLQEKDRRRRVKEELPEKLKFLVNVPIRYKVARGGRGSAKSHSFARSLLILGSERPLRILCTREVQKSIRDSVHKLLCDLIPVLGLGEFYSVIRDEIRGVNGTLFIFSGLSDKTAESIKSYEGVDIVWCEEAQAISKRSWTILIPTIRKDGSEIWISYNPELETDETHKRFAINPPEDCISVLVNHSDNPWFPSVLEKERLACKRDYPDEYENIWEGQCKPAVVGAIYYKEVAAAEANQQFCNVPHDPNLKVHVVWDLGWNDSMFITLVQRLRSEIRIIKSFEDDHRTLDSYSAELRNLPYKWGKLYLPHDGKHADFKTGKSSGAILTALGWDVDYTENLSVEDGIKIVRRTFPQMYVDKANAAGLIECMKRYRRVVNTTTNEAGAPMHDQYSHGADNLRYIAINADKMTNEEDIPARSVSSLMSGGGLRGDF